MGRGEGVEKPLAKRAGLPYIAVAAAPVLGTSPLGLLRNLASLLKGTVEAYRALRRVKPHAIFSTGGYVSVPVVLGGWLQGIPSLLYLPDLEPGLAVRALARVAKRVAVTNEEAAKHFKANDVVITGYPVRSGFAKLGREEVRKHFSVTADKVLLAFGGSRGASAINAAVEEALDGLLEIGDVIHVCGAQDYARLEARRQEMSEDRRGRYHLFEYLHEDMPAALKAADVVISRAGASILGEFTVAGVAAILVPYPYAGQHQRQNAAYLADRGAAIILENDNLSGSTLLSTVSGLMRDEPRLNALRGSAARLARPDAAARLATLLRSLPAGKVA
jgi:UDP-N-acetylglucosamine--N-acetylmuramyl-(pentapeptide) pyrophosphoryl-undecaprenol N-acetylglucosamine transferase